MTWVDITPPPIGRPVCLCVCLQITRFSPTQKVPVTRGDITRACRGFCVQRDFVTVLVRAKKVMTRVTVWFSNVDQEESKRSFRRGRNTTSARHLGCKVWENASLQASTGASIVAAVFRVGLWPLAVCANRPPTAPRHVEATQTHHTREPSRCHKHTCARTDTITATTTSRPPRDTEAFIVSAAFQFRLWPFAVCTNQQGGIDARPATATRHPHAHPGTQAFVIVNALATTPGPLYAVSRTGGWKEKVL